ncbi:MAG: cytochrome b/b6 domain-containing protein [Firmicutes bacterium]|nr:cytochrome b/b6 domain-containing protein [Bacillota bacterium]
MANKEPNIGIVKDGKVRRFTKAGIAAHWVHTVTFLTLLLTGLSIYVPATTWIGNLFGGIQNARIIHRVVAIPYALFALVLLLVGSRQQMKEWLKVAFTWKKEDFIFSAKYIVTEFMGRHGDLPEADFINSGEKVNSILTVGTLFTLTISGFVMWFPETFPKWAVRLAYPIHDLSWLFMTSMLLVHMYLSLIHPKMRTALKGMTTGWVDEEFAKSHYPKWYRRVTGKDA